MEPRRPGRSARIALVATGSFAAVLAAVFAYDADRRGRVEDELFRAREALNPPFEAVPTLDRIDCATAIEALERAFLLGESGAEARGLHHYAEALEDLQRGDLVLAEGELASALTFLGPTLDLQRLAAALSSARMLSEQAEAEIEKAIEIDPRDPRTRLLAADLAADRGQLDRALELLEDLIHQYEGAHAVRNRLGLVLEKLGRWQDAEAAYRRASDDDREGQDAFVNLGRMLRARGAHAEALAAFRTAADRAPTDSAAILGRGLCHAAMGSFEAADQDFVRAAELAPNDAEPELARGDLARTAGRLEEAIEHYRAALSREDADAASWVKLGNVLAQRREWREAQLAFEEAVRRAPLLAAAHNGLGAASLHLHQEERALEALERAAELDPEDPSPWMNLAVLRERHGDRAEARAAWRAALARNPSSAFLKARAAS